MKRDHGTGQRDRKKKRNGIAGLDNGSTYITGPEHSPSAKELSLTIVNFYIALHHKSKNKKGTTGPDSGTGNRAGWQDWTTGLLI